MIDVKQIFGNIDIYIFDQILKDRFEKDSKILDVGCGGGRNLIYFLQNDFEVYAIDQNPEAVEYARYLANNLSSRSSQSNFQISSAEKMHFEDAKFDTVLCNSVLHFAENEEHFLAMIYEMWRVLKSGGLFFARLASTIGIEDKIRPIGNGKFLLPNGVEWFLVDEEMLISLSEEIGGMFIEPIKTTNVQNMRCMTTWILRKN